jgi:hypothetical protein
MSEKLLIQEIDAQTGESNIRPFTSEEVAAYKSFQSQIALTEAETQAKVDAKTSALAKLAALGLTEEEIAAL